MDFNPGPRGAREPGWGSSHRGEHGGGPPAPWTVSPAGLANSSQALGQRVRERARARNGSSSLRLGSMAGVS